MTTVTTADRPSTTKAMADIAHDARGAVGTIRLAVTTLLDAGDDAAIRNELLTSVEAEAARLAVELGALAPLVAALTDETKPAPVDLVAALERVGVEVSGGDRPTVLVRPGSFDAALAAVAHLLDATTATVHGGAVHFRTTSPESRTLQHLVAAMGATTQSSGDGLTIEFCS